MKLFINYTLNYYVIKVKITKNLMTNVFKLINREVFKC